MERGIVVDLDEIRNNLSVKAKNGIGFLLSAVVIWLIIGLIFMQALEIETKNLYMLFATGLMFPLSVGISTMIKADWQLKNNPLGQLGLYLNLAQLIYFPILFFAMMVQAELAVAIFAMITGAHFFPYGWFYKAKAYYILAPIISVTMMFLALFSQGKLWILPLTMAGFLLLLIVLLIFDYKNKRKVVYE